MGGSEVRCARHPSKPRADDCAVLRVSPNTYMATGACCATVDPGSWVEASETVTAGALSGEVTIVWADRGLSKRKRSSVEMGGGSDGASSREKRTRRGRVGVSDIVGHAHPSSPEDFLDVSSGEERLLGISKKVIC